MTHVMEHAARQVTSLGAELRTLCSITSATQPSGPGSGWDITAATLPSPSTSNPAFKSDTYTEHYDKLIIATGSFSDPAVPSFARPFLLPPRATLAQEAVKLEENTPFAIHTSHLSEPVVQKALMMKKRKVIVVGASKSALDASERLALVSIALGGDRHVQLTLVRFLWLFSTTTTSRSFSGILHTSPHRLLNIPRRANQQTRLVLSVHACVSILISHLLLTDIHNPTAQNLNDPILPRPRPHLHPFLVLLPVLEPNIVLHRRPHLFSIPLRPPLDISRKFHPQATRQRGYEGVRELGWVVGRRK